MERKIINDFLKWKRDSINKPLFLYGPKCIGKTFSVLEFGRKFYKNIAYFDTENNSELLSIIDKSFHYLSSIFENIEHISALVIVPLGLNVPSGYPLIRPALTHLLIASLPQ